MTIEPGSPQSSKKNVELLLFLSPEACLKPGISPQQCSTIAVGITGFGLLYPQCLSCISVLQQSKSESAGAYWSETQAEG